MGQRDSPELAELEEAFCKAVQKLSQLGPAERRDRLITIMRILNSLRGASYEKMLRKGIEICAGDGADH